MKRIALAVALVALAAPAPASAFDSSRAASGLAARIANAVYRSLKAANCFGPIHVLWDQDARALPTRQAEDPGDPGGRGPGTGNAGDPPKE